MFYPKYKRQNSKNQTNQLLSSTFYNSFNSSQPKQLIDNQRSYCSNKYSNLFSDHLRSTEKTFIQNKNYSKSLKKPIQEKNICPNNQFITNFNLNDVRINFDKYSYLKFKHYPHSAYCSQNLKIKNKKHEQQDNNITNIHYHYHYNYNYNYPSTKLVSEPIIPQRVIKKIPLTPKPKLIKQFRNEINIPVKFSFKKYSPNKLIKFKYLSPPKMVYRQQKSSNQLLCKKNTEQFLHTIKIPQQNIKQPAIRQLRIQSSQIMYEHSKRIEKNKVQNRPSIFKKQKNNCSFIAISSTQQ